ncbi:MAG: thioredoxin family protein [Acidobacteriota bacterium]
MTTQRRALFAMSAALSITLSVVPALLFAPPAAEACGDYGELSNEIRWTQITRDVYLGGRMLTDARVYVAEEPERMAVLLPDADQAFVVDGDYGLRTLAASSFAPGETPLEAKSPTPGEDGPMGKAHPVGEGLLLDTGGRESLLVLPHEGPAGDLEEAALWSAVPAWRLLADAWAPEDDVVEALRRVEEPTELLVALGTWCGDSRRSVPRLMAALEAAANPKISVRMVAIGRGFTEPLDFVRNRRVTNVPTIIVQQGGREVGRFVERPRGASVDVDLAAILGGEPSAPRARAADTDRPIASGRYRLVDSAGAEVGIETWELFATEDGGTRLHSRGVRGPAKTEVWHRRDAEGKTDFIEVTRDDGFELSRTRAWPGDGRVQATTRGNATGIVRQTVHVGDGLMATPSLADAGLMWHLAGRPDRVPELEAFVVEGAGAPVAGHVEPLAFRHLSGTDGAAAVERRLGEEVTEWWLHPSLGVPVRAELGGGVRLELASLEMESADSNPRDAVSISRSGD